jgi:hypothetical protein
MIKQLLSLGIIFAVLLIIPFASAQSFEKATFQESAIIIFDQKFSESIIASIGFETTDNNEIRFSEETIQKINNNEKIRSIVITNVGQCVIGVTEDEQCVLVNFDYQQLKGDGGIRQVQDSAKEMSKELVDGINKTFGFNAKFHSTFIHTVDDANILLETSGAVSGRGSVSATYTMPKQSTDFLFLDLAGKLIPKSIRDAEGFYDIAKKLSKNDDSIISISIIRNDNSNLLMFKVTNEIKDESMDISKIDPLDELGIDSISRSNIFDEKNAPLNSVIQVIVIPTEQSQIDAISTHAITDLTSLENISKKGWFFSSPAGNKIDARFLFGIDKLATADELKIEIGSWDGQSQMSFYSVEDIQQESEYKSIEDFSKDNSDEEDQSQYLILGIIIVAAIGATMFYLKGYKPKH